MDTSGRYDAFGPGTPRRSVDEHGGGLTGSFPADAAEELGEITERAARVMRLPHVPVWLTTPIEALDRRTPIDAIGAGEGRSVQQVLSALEDPGAS